MFSSTIIPTVGRPTLARAVESVLGQGLPGHDVEVIVVNDSGRPLRRERWQASKQVQVLETQRRERSVARNTGAAVARGRYLHFLDDDDWLAPGGLHHLRQLAAATNAAWLYGATQLVDRGGKPLAHLRHTVFGNCFAQAMAGEWLPLQASLVAAPQFFALGGFNPQITGPEDVDLLRRFALANDVAGTHELVANISWGDAGSTTPHARHAGYSRWAREQILKQAGAFERMQASAPSAYWRGRVARVYLTSVVWNARRGAWLAAGSRAATALAALAWAGPRALLPDFWRALAGPYQSQTFSRGLT
jgi:glycosyltransferase involved in cell wall biosynthesis